MANALPSSVITAMKDQPLDRQNVDYYFLSGSEITSLEATIRSAIPTGWTVGNLGEFSYQQSFTSAYNSWRSVADLGPDANPSSNLAEAGILVVAVSQAFTAPKGNDVEEIGGAVLTLTDGRKVVLLNDVGQNNATYYSMGNAGYATVLHEIGHALGLKHPFSEPDKPAAVPSGTDGEKYTVMSYTEHDHRPVTPQLFDIGVLQLGEAQAPNTMYGANTNTRSEGNSAYRFLDEEGLPISDDANGQTVRRYNRQDLEMGELVMPMVSIWDAAGSGDTIDASGVTGGVDINLTAGGFSRIGSAGVNVSIAYGVTIENAIGGNQNDKLVGNQVANKLEGGAGKDVLDGGVADNAGTSNVPIGRGDGQADTLVGGTDFDTYILRVNGQDVLHGINGAGFTFPVQSDASEVWCEGLPRFGGRAARRRASSI